MRLYLAIRDRNQRVFFLTRESGGACSWAVGVSTVMPVLGAGSLLKFSRTFHFITRQRQRPKTHLLTHLCSKAARSSKGKRFCPLSLSLPPPPPPPFLSYKINQGNLSQRPQWIPLGVLDQDGPHVPVLATRDWGREALVILAPGAGDGLCKKKWENGGRGKRWAGPQRGPDGPVTSTQAVPGRGLCLPPEHILWTLEPNCRVLPRQGGVRRARICLPLRRLKSSGGRI